MLVLPSGLTYHGSLGVACRSRFTFACAGYFLRARSGKVAAREVMASRDSLLSTIVALGRLHLIVAFQNGKTSRFSVVCHCPFSSKAPSRLFGINCDVYVVSVEDAFAQVSMRAPVESLTLLAFELCDIYSLLPNGTLLPPSH